MEIIGSYRPFTTSLYLMTPIFCIKFLLPKLYYLFIHSFIHYIHYLSGLSGVICSVLSVYPLLQ